MNTRELRLQINGKSHLSLYAVNNYFKFFLTTLLYVVFIVQYVDNLSTKINFARESKAGTQSSLSNNTFVRCVYSAIRWYVTTKMNLARESEAGTQSTDAIFRSTLQTSCNSGDIDLDALHVDLSSQLDMFTNNGSGWSLISIDDFTVHVARFNPLVGSSFIKTPRFIKLKRATINVKNKTDQYCFRWAVLSALFPLEQRDHPECVYRG